MINKIAQGFQPMPAGPAVTMKRREFPVAGLPRAPAA